MNIIETSEMKGKFHPNTQPHSDNINNISTIRNDLYKKDKKNLQQKKGTAKKEGLPKGKPS